MKTDVDTCLKEIADWYVKNRREITEPELESILLKHCEDAAEVQKFVGFLETEPGELRFKTLLRERKELNPGEQEVAIRGTQVLASSRYITKKLDTWRAIDKCTFRKAYEEGDWKTVYELTPDLTGSTYSRQRTLSDLYSVLLEQKCEYPKVR